MHVTPANRIADGEISDLWTYILKAHCSLKDPANWTGFNSESQHLLDQQIRDRARLAQLQALVESGEIEPVTRARDEAYAAAFVMYAEDREENRLARLRYSAMLAQFNKWEPPQNDEARKLARTARSYVQDSLRMSMYELPEPIKEKPIPWITAEIIRLTERVKETDQYIENRRNEAVQATLAMFALRASLEQFRPK
jgi:hypothetical protein